MVWSVARPSQPHSVHCGKKEIWPKSVLAGTGVALDIPDGSGLEVIDHHIIISNECIKGLTGRTEKGAESPTLSRYSLGRSYSPWCCHHGGPPGA